MFDEIFLLPDLISSQLPQLCLRTLGVYLKCIDFSTLLLLHLTEILLFYHRLETLTCHQRTIHSNTFLST